MNEPRLPIYLLVDCSDAMAGEPLETVAKSIQELVELLRNDPALVQQATILAIPYSDQPGPVGPWADLDAFNMPSLQAHGSACLGSALDALLERVEQDRTACAGTGMPNARPVVFIFASGQIADEDAYDLAAQAARSAGLGAIVACVASEDTDAQALEKLTDHIVSLQGATPGVLSEFVAFSPDATAETGTDAVACEPSAKHAEPPERVCLRKTIPVDLQKRQPDDAQSQVNLKKPPSQTAPATAGMSRRLPVYILADCSRSMRGAHIAALENGIRTLVDELRSDPQALESACLSLIEFSSDAKQVVPLTDLMRFEVPDLEADGTTATGKALELLMDCASREVRKATAEHKGDWRPIVFILTDGAPTDWEKFNDVAPKVKQSGFANIIACAAGEATADYMKQVTDNVLRLDHLTPDDLKSFFAWVSNSIQISSKGISGGKPVALPAPPDGFVIVE